MDTTTLTIPITLTSEALDLLRAVLLEHEDHHEHHHERPAWMTVKEAAEYLRCKPQRIYDLRSSGQLPRHGDGARVLLHRDDLDRHVGLTCGTTAHRSRISGTDNRNGRATRERPRP
jgi:excisionase family DNA binding protein